VFFAFPIFFTAFLLFNLKIVVCAVVIEDLVIAGAEEEAVLVNLGLDKITFIGQDRQGPVDVMELIRGRFQETLCGVEGGTFAGGVKDSGINQVGKDGVQVEFVLVSPLDFCADGIQSQFIVKLLKKEIAAVKESLLMVVQKALGMEGDKNGVFFLFIIIFFGFDSGLFLGPGHNAVPVSAELCGELSEGAKLRIIVEVLLPSLLVKDLEI
jgi:hypothetical protein